MKSENKALVGIFALGIALTSTSAFAEKPDWASGLSEVDKCAGVAQKGKNDCGTKNHECGGKAKSDDMADEWVFTPKGLCEKIGGKVAGTEKMKK
ncbi:MAG TPA: DUF2282 domain-containing protein [Bacteriovoracaceae bacterium]|nr:DUF2282 domain-containing protein [Bacteriovoracaceae bacterium]